MKSTGNHLGGIVGIATGIDNARRGPVAFYTVSFGGIETKECSTSADVARALIDHYGWPADRFMALVETIDASDHLTHPDLGLSIRAVRYDRAASTVRR